jgi:hypothetical protein
MDRLAEELFAAAVRWAEAHGSRGVTRVILELSDAPAVPLRVPRPAATGREEVPVEAAGE